MLVYLPREYRPQCPTSKYFNEWTGNYPKRILKHQWPMKLKIGKYVPVETRSALKNLSKVPSKNNLAHLSSAMTILFLHYVPMIIFNANLHTGTLNEICPWVRQDMLTINNQ